MSIQVIDNFEVRVQKAIDNRFVVGTGQFYTDKNDIEYKYPGLRIWDLDAGVSGVPFVWDGVAWVSEATSSVTGGGTIGTIPKFQGSSNNLGDSIIKESSSQIGIGLAGTPTEKLDVNGNVKATKFIGLAWSGGSGLTNINLGTNGSNVIGTIALTNLQNGSQGRILVAGAAAPEWLDQVQIGTAPASGTPGTGLYFKNTVTSRLYAVSGSGLRFTIGSTNTLDVVEGQIRVSNGSAGSPAISFIGDPNTGIYNVSGDIMGFSTGGSQRLNISTVDVVASVPIKVPNGTVADPGLKVGSNFTGLSREVVSTLPNVEEYLKLSVNQTLLLSLNRTGNFLSPSYNITSYYPFRNANGSESAPSYSFNGDANTGMYRYGSDSIGFSLASKLRWRMRLGGATDFEFWNHNGSSGFNGAFANYGSYLKLQDFTHLEIGGNLIASGTKSFKIQHPLDKDKYLIHAAIEGPRVDNIYRGTTKLVKGKSEINIDSEFNMTQGTFESLNRDIQCFTSNETGFDNVKGTVIGNKLLIDSSNSKSTDTISWMVIGERKDKSIIESVATDENGKLITETSK